MEFEFFLVDLQLECLEFAVAEFGHQADQGAELMGLVVVRMLEGLELGLEGLVLEEFEGRREEVGGFARRAFGEVRG